jgi:signal transduction histidine kinase
MKLLDRLFNLSFFNINLRVKIMLVFILPTAFALALISYFHNVRERAELEALAENSSFQLADSMLGLLNHAMVLDDKGMIQSAMERVGSSPSIEEVSIISPEAVVYASTNPAKTGVKLDLRQAGCVECHQYTAKDRPRAMQIWIREKILRVSTPIPNSEECLACHPSSQHLGIFLIDLSTMDIEEHLREDMVYNSLLSAASILSLIVMAYLLTQWLVVRRINVLHAALARLNRRDFSARVTTRWRTRDEITELADHLNRVAESLESLQIEHEQKDKVRAQAIIDERERIARELHDGVAQFLGYLSTKIGATRMALKNQKNDIADRNLEQVEQAIHDQSSEVRSSIIGLKMAGNIDRGFANNVRDFIEQCNRLDDLSLELEISPAVDELEMEIAIELQLFRILQEAVSNIRKHSRASEASIHLGKNEGSLTMAIFDNGVGFDPVQTGLERGGHFGLQIMFERAREIGAHVEIRSNPGAGTQITVTMNVGDTHHENTGS